MATQERGIGARTQQVTGMYSLFWPFTCLHPWCVCACAIIAGSPLRMWPRDSASPGRSRTRLRSAPIKSNQSRESIPRITGYNYHLQNYSHVDLLPSRRADRAQRSGAFDREIVPVTTTLTDGEGRERTVTVAKDDGVRVATTLEGLAKLRAAFKPGGSTTAGTSSASQLHFCSLFTNFLKCCQRIGQRF